jgi:V/A-type H+-transporting ATPase subunit E
MKHNKENLEGIVSKLKEQGVNAGELEKEKIIENAKAEAAKLIADARASSETIIKEAETKAEQTEKNAQTAIAQASRDMVEATKIAVLKYLKSVFGAQCETLFTEAKYLQELLKAVLESMSGQKSVKVAPEVQKEMEAFLLKEALKDEVTLEPLSQSKAKIKMKSEGKDGVSFVLSAEDVEQALFALLNKDLVERITKAQEE